MAWTEPMVERASALRKDEVPCSEIARTITYEFGVPISRNAVIGMLYRKGVARRPKIQRLVNRGPAGFDIVDVNAPPPPQPPPADDLRIPLAKRCGLLDLTPDTCRWPVGDPLDAAFFFCGAQVTLGEVYCVGHCGRAWAIRPPRRR